MLPRKYVVGLLIVNKLVQENMWGGKNKGYLWSDDLAKGRGVPDDFKDVIHDVVNMLFLNDILINKQSQGKKKYAVNPAIRNDIHEFLDARAFSGRVHELLSRDTSRVSSRMLDRISDDMDEY